MDAFVPSHSMEVRTMSERTINEIQIAVQEADANISDEELRLCVESLRTIAHFYCESLRSLSDAIKQGKPQVLIELRAGFANATIERMFMAQKKTPREWLGPSNIPGTSEYKQRLEYGKRLYKKATGEDL